MTVPGVTSKPTNEYTPAVSTRSCTSAPSAAIAIRCSNLIQIYALTTTRKTRRPISAFLVTCLPQEELTSDMLISVGSTLALREIAWITAVRCSSLSFGVRISYLRLSPDPRTWADETSMPTLSAAELDPEVEVAEDDREQADQDDHAGGDVPPLAGADEIDVRLAPVEPAEDRHDHDSFVRTAPSLGTFCPAIARSERALPSPENRGEVKLLNRASTATSGWVNRKTTSTSMIVDMPRVKAKPFTGPAARM